MSSSEMSSFESISMRLPEDLGFATYFKRLYELRIQTDVDFDLLGPEGPVIFSAHKMILSLWSPYFADKFYSSEENTKMGNVINILQYNDVKPEAFEAMLRFMYGVHPSLQDHKKACELFKLAIKFDVNSLQRTCRQFLNELSVTPSNVFDILVASNYMGNKSRTDTCLKLIQEKTKEVMESFDLSGISPNMLNTFLDLGAMSLSGEYELLTWVFSWAKNRCEENNQYSNVREVLEPFFPKLNFLALSNKDFTTLCSEWKDVFTKDEIIAIFMNIGVSGSCEMPEWYDANRPFRIYNDSTATAVKEVS